MSSSSQYPGQRQSAIVRRDRAQVAPFASLVRERAASAIADRIVIGGSAPASGFVLLVPSAEASPRPAGEAPRSQPAEDVAQLLRDARRQAADIVASAHESARVIRESAEQEGREEGYQSGLRQAETEIGESARTVSALAEQARVDYHSLTLTVERQVADLAIAVARKVIERELATDDTMILNVVRAALHEVEDTNAVRVRVRVNPAYQPTIAMYWHNEGSNVEFVGDPDLALGDCLVDSDAFGLDARVETRLAEIAAAIDAVLDGRRGDSPPTRNLEAEG